MLNESLCQACQHVRNCCTTDRQLRCSQLNTHSQYLIAPYTLMLQVVHILEAQELVTVSSPVSKAKVMHNLPRSPLWVYEKSQLAFICIHPCCFSCLLSTASAVQTVVMQTVVFLCNTRHEDILNKSTMKPQTNHCILTAVPLLSKDMSLCAHFSWCPMQSS